MRFVLPGPFLFPTTSTSAALMRMSSMLVMRMSSMLVFKKGTNFYSSARHTCTIHDLPTPMRRQQKVGVENIDECGQRHVSAVHGTGKTPSWQSAEARRYRVGSNTNLGWRNQKRNSKFTNHPCNPQRSYILLHPVLSHIH